MIYIQKLTESRGQYSVTLPKHLVESIGLNKARIVEIWKTEESVIHIREYHAKEAKK